MIILHLYYTYDDDDDDDNIAGLFFLENLVPCVLQSPSFVCRDELVPI